MFALAPASDFVLTNINEQRQQNGNEHIDDRFESVKGDQMICVLEKTKAAH